MVFFKACSASSAFFSRFPCLGRSCSSSSSTCNLNMLLLNVPDVNALAPEASASFAEVRPVCRPICAAICCFVGLTVSLVAAASSSPSSPSASLPSIIFSSSSPFTALLSSALPELPKDANDAASSSSSPEDTWSIFLLLFPAMAMFVFVLANNDSSRRLSQKVVARIQKFTSKLRRQAGPSRKRAKSRFKGSGSMQFSDTAIAEVADTFPANISCWNSNVIHALLPDSLCKTITSLHYTTSIPTMPGVLLPFNETVGNTIPPDTPHVSEAFLASHTTALTLSLRQSVFRCQHGTPMSATRRARAG